MRWEVARNEPEKEVVKLDKFEFVEFRQQSEFLQIKQPRTKEQLGKLLVTMSPGVFWGNSFHEDHTRSVEESRLVKGMKLKFRCLEFS